MSDTLRSKLIRLAHENPNLRADLLPLLTASRGKTASKEFVQAYLPFLKDPRYADDLEYDVSDLFSTVRMSLIESVLENITDAHRRTITTSSKFKPFKAKGTNTREDGRTLSEDWEAETVEYWYTIEYPDQVFLGGVFKVELLPLWVKAHESLGYLKGHPPLEGVFLHEVLKGVPGLMREVADFNKGHHTLSGKADEAVEDWLYQNGKIDIDVTTTIYKDDGTEEVAPESYSPHPKWSFIVGNLTVETKVSGTNLTAKAVLPLTVSLSDVSAPGDHDYHH